MDGSGDPEDEGRSWASMSKYPVSYAVRNHVMLFQATFHKKRYPLFFHRLEQIVKRKLSYSERENIISACFELADNKFYLETKEDLRRQLKWEAELEKSEISDLEEIKSLADQLLRRIESLNISISLVARPKILEFRSRLYEPLDEECSGAPIVEVLQRVVNTSKNIVEEHKPAGKPGPLPDVAQKKCITKLAQVFGENPTAPFIRSEGRRASPFIDFVQQILYALPDNAMIGTKGPYLPAAVEGHVAAVCKELKKALPERNKTPKLAD